MKFLLKITTLHVQCKFVMGTINNKHLKSVPFRHFNLKHYLQNPDIKEHTPEFPCGFKKDKSFMYSVNNSSRNCYIRKMSRIISD